jgi:hypothetical protein
MGGRSSRSCRMGGRSSSNVECHPDPAAAARWWGAVPPRGA